MAHATLHFTAGLAVGLLTQTPALRRVWHQGRDRAPAVMRWLLVSWGLGVWAIVPSLLHDAGLPPAVCNGWGMNLFLFHPLINRWGPHATLIGSALLVSLFALQYIVILAAIQKTRQRPRR